MLPFSLRHILPNLGVVLGSIVLTLCCVELALRVVGLSFPVFMQPNDTLGWSYFPDVEGYSVHEGTTWVKINADGFRDRHHERVKPSSTFRVAVVGDSFTEGSNVAFEDTFPTVVERELASCSMFKKQRVEVLNFGVSGYGTAQSYLLLRQHVLLYEPDLVVLAFYNGNDVADNSIVLSAETQKGRPFYLIRDGRLVLDASFHEAVAFKKAKRESRLVHAFLNKSYVFQLCKQLYLGRLILPGHPMSRIERFDEAQHGSSTLKPLFPEVYSRPVDPVWEEAWKVTEALILAMRDVVKSQGAEFLVVMIPEPAQVYPDPPTRERMKQAYGLSDLAYPERRFKPYAQAAQLDILMLLEPFLETLSKDPVFYHGFPPTYGAGHWNPAGNHAGGQLIARHICSKYSKRS